MEHGMVNYKGHRCILHASGLLSSRSQRELSSRDFHLKFLGGIKSIYKASISDWSPTSLEEHEGE
jgi:hypothetical protein